MIAVSVAGHLVREGSRAEELMKQSPLCLGIFTQAAMYRFRLPLHHLAVYLASTLDPDNYFGEDPDYDPVPEWLIILIQIAQIGTILFVIAGSFLLLTSI